MHCPRLSIFTLALLVAGCGSLFAQQAQMSPAEQKLRESLRNTMLQLRNAENDKAVLQATQADDEEKIKNLTEQTEKLSKQIVADKDASDKAAATLQGQVDERDKQIAAYKDGVMKLQTEVKQITDIANTKEAQRAKLDDQVIQLNRRVADQQVKNAGMFKIANEILLRYEKFGLGDALTAREPFTGITRVKLQSLFEDYQDKLVDEKIKPEQAKAPETKPTPTPDKTNKSKATPAKTTAQSSRS